MSPGDWEWKIKVQSWMHCGVGIAWIKAIQQRQQQQQARQKQSYHVVVIRGIPQTVTKYTINEFSMSICITLGNENSRNGESAPPTQQHQQHQNQDEYCWSVISSDSPCVLLGHNMEHWTCFQIHQPPHISTRNRKMNRVQNRNGVTPHRTTIQKTIIKIPLH